MSGMSTISEPTLGSQRISSTAQKPQNRPTPKPPQGSCPCMRFFISQSVFVSRPWSWHQNDPVILAGDHAGITRNHMKSPEIIWNHRKSYEILRNHMKSSSRLRLSSCFGAHLDRLVPVPLTDPMGSLKRQRDQPCLGRAKRRRYLNQRAAGTDCSIVTNQDKQQQTQQVFIKAWRIKKHIEAPKDAEVLRTNNGRSLLLPLEFGRGTCSKGARIASGLSAP